MMNPQNYTPPEVWEWDQAEGAASSSKLNRPIAGPTHETELPQGEHPLQLYSLGTPNGQKVTILLEELLQLEIQEAEYDAWLINIGEGDQFSSGFLAVNPNSKIPALLDRTNNLRVFESGSILLYLADKHQQFLPQSTAGRTEALNWLFWLQGSAPYLGGGFGHFYHYAPEKIEYAINRFAMEIKRQLDVLDRELAHKKFLTGEEYSIADIATWPWYGSLVRGEIYEAGKFLQVNNYLNVVRWAQEIFERPAVQRGRRVNRTWGDETEQLRERHSAADFE